MAIDTIGVNALATGSITSAKIADGTIIAADVADGSVTTVKLADDAVTSAKLGASAVDATALASNAVATAKIADGAVTQAKTTAVGGLVKLSTVTVASGSATDYAFNFTNVFSSTYDDYLFDFNIITNETHAGNVMYAQFGNGGTYVTSGNACRGTQIYNQAGDSAVSGKQYYYSTTGIHQLLGTLVSTEDGIFTGIGTIRFVRDAAQPTSIIIHQALMQYKSTEAYSYLENGGSREDSGDQAAYTDVRFGVIIGQHTGTNVSSSADRRNVYGQVTMYGMLK